LLPACGKNVLVEETYAHAATLRMEPGRESRWVTLSSGPADPGDHEL
jgi:hypothetical protein